MTCVGVREHLPEFALGVLPETDRARVERHLRECAGCRKEAGELELGAATFALALAPVTPPAGLGDRVVQAIGRRARRSGPKRRTRTFLAAAIAATVATAGLGWGVVMAGRAQKFADRANQAELRRDQALDQFQHVLRSLPLQVEADETHLGQLSPTSGIPHGGGAVLELVSPTRLDFVVVIVSGLPRGATSPPYRVQLLNAAGRVLRAGTIAQLDADGGADVFHQFPNTDLTGFTTVVVRDGTGRVVLRGTVDQGTGS